MKVDYSVNGQAAVLSLSGELDHHSVRQAITVLDDVIDVYMPKELILDFAGVGFMDSSGLALVMGGYRKITGMDGALVLRNVPHQPLKVLTAAGLTKIVTIRKEDEV